MAVNNRIYYAIQQIAMGPAGSEVEIHGAQSIGITSNFNLEEIFELGQLALYENSETVPDVEVTAQKVLDGYPLIYQLATETGCSEDSGAIATGPDLAGRQVGKTDVYLTIWPDDKLSCGYSGAAALDNACAELCCSGMYVSSVSYTFPVEGTFTEDVTLVGNNKRWRTPTVGGKFTTNEDSPAAPTGVGRRQDLNMGSSIFPDDIPGITAQVFSGDSYVSGGKNERIVGGGEGDSSLAQGHNAHFSNITVSSDFGGRESIFELGSLKPYYRYINFPVEVTCELEVTATVGDCVVVDDNLGGEDEYCPTDSTLKNQKIRIVSCEGTTLDLGAKNKLQSVNYTGGDTGGGNVTITYSYSNFNDLVVAHSSSALFPTVG
jgi:hypothetical protein